MGMRRASEWVQGHLHVSWGHGYEASQGNQIVRWIHVRSTIQTYFNEHYTAQGERGKERAPFKSCR